MLPANRNNAKLPSDCDIHDIHAELHADDSQLRVHMRYGGSFHVRVDTSFTVRSHKLRKIMDKVFHTTETPLHRQIQYAQQCKDIEESVFRALQSHVTLISEVILYVMSVVSKKLDYIGSTSEPLRYAHIKGISIVNTTELPVRLSFDLGKSTMEIELPFLLETKVF